jgi:D-alanine-D-alanine ligase
VTGNARRRIAILHGEVPENAPEDEQDVLVEVETVKGALGRMGYEAVPVVFCLDVPRALSALRKIEPALVFNLVESVQGKDRLIHLAPAVLDSVGLPYTGSPTEAIFLTSHKLLTKRFLRSANIATPAWFCRDIADGTLLPRGGRYIIKSVWEHASIGLDGGSIVETDDPAELRRRLEERAALMKGEVFAEAFVDGREFNISLLEGPDGPEVLPHAEILFVDYPEGKPRVVDYKAKWDEKSFEYSHTPRSFEFPTSDAGLLASLSELSKECWRLFGLRGYARVDFRVDAKGRPWVLEINANPCLSPDGGFYAAVRQAGLSIEEAVQRILDAAR